MCWLTETSRIANSTPDYKHSNSFSLWHFHAGPDILQTKSKNELIWCNFEQNQAKTKFVLSLFRQFETAHQSEIAAKLVVEDPELCKMQ